MNSCKSWYVDASGHNSTNWPGFTLTYRWITRFTGMGAYRFTHPLPESAAPARDVVVAPPVGRLEALTAASRALRVAFRPLIGPPFGARMQRRVVALLSPLMPGTSGTLRYRTSAHRVPVEVVAPKRGDTGGAILYLHGGAFCLGGPHTHRGVTTRLANDAGLPVWVPDYRLARASASGRARRCAGRL